MFYCEDKNNLSLSNWDIDLAEKSLILFSKVIMCSCILVVLVIVVTDVADFDDDDVVFLGDDVIDAIFS